MTDANLVIAIARWRQEALAEAYRRRGGGVFERCSGRSYVLAQAGLVAT